MLSRQRRRPGSVRFAPYYKVQWWDERAMAWRDVQRSHQSQRLAELAGPSAAAEARRRSHLPYVPQPRWRLMRITPEGRTPLEEHPRG